MSFAVAQAHMYQHPAPHEHAPLHALLELARDVASCTESQCNTIDHACISSRGTTTDTTSFLRSLRTTFHFTPSFFTSGFLTEAASTRLVASGTQQLCVPSARSIRKGLEKTLQTPLLSGWTRSQLLYADTGSTSSVIHRDGPLGSAFKAGQVDQVDLTLLLGQSLGP
jgi:hypothetical protein